MYISGYTSKSEKLLRRWLNRASHPTKKGTMLNISYTVRGWHNRSRWDAVLAEYIDDEKRQRSADEAAKIKAGLYA